MAALKLLVGLVLVVLACGQSSLRMRTNPKGMNFMWKQLEQMGLSIHLNDIQFEEIRGVLIRTFNTTGLQVTGIEFGEVAPFQLNEDSYSLKVIGSSFDISSQYSLYVGYPGVAVIDSSGDLNFNYNLSFTLNMDIVLNNIVQNALYDVTGCNVEVHASAITNREDFDSGHSIVANAIENLLSTNYKAEFKTQFCAVIGPTVEAILTQQAQSIPLTTEILPGVMLNTSLYVLPIINSGSVENRFDGRGYPASQPDISYPYQREDLTEFSSSNKMIQVAIGEYSLQTILHTMVDSGIMDLVIDASEIQIGSSNLGTLLSVVIPGLKNFYTEDGNIQLRLQTNQVPTIDITAGHINGQGSSSLSVEAVAGDGTIKLATKFQMTVSAVAMANFANNRVYVNITYLQASFAVEKSPAGDVNINLINGALASQSANPVLLPLVNAQLANGFSLPIGLVARYSAVNTDVEITENAVIIAFDLQPAANAEEGSGDATIN